ncbi:antibiotic biosynthesis monooxygenase [Aeromicrobium sp. CF4.19]|uniref:antibiotic biosynthesis monooxygenase n=1 Tax=Aeromicrobium sp. CF4.19 TaxID=3373082 RepID=UPI003EE4E3B5
MPGPVTVSITRHVDPAQEMQMLAWLRAGMEMAERFDGFLGSGWVRPSPGSAEWHMLYRFADADHLEGWMTSEQRRWWLDSAQGLVDESMLERRTGIEGWFDEPSSVDVEDLRPAPAPPPRWKQMVAIFIVFWPLSLVTNTLGAWAAPDLWLPARVTLTVCLMTPLMTYLLLPWITGLLAPWLSRRRA